jgi:hypothetical protein
VHLVIKALAKVAEYYYTSAKKLTEKNITIPHTNMLNQIPSFPCTVLQGLSIHPWVMSDILSELLDWLFLTQFAELVKLLTGFGKSQAVVSLDNPKVSDTQHKQLEDQQLQNKERDLANLNGKLRRKKRKSIEIPSPSLISRRGNWKR